jgi:hypothetical protein
MATDVIVGFGEVGFDGTRLKNVMFDIRIFPQ